MGDTPEPTTTAIATGWRTRIDPRRGLARVQESSIAILQIVVATTGAYAFAHYVLGHPAPLLAATVCVSSLGLVRDARPRRVLETVLGMLVGILVAELLLLAAGPGWWQLALALGLTLVVARFLSAQASFAIAAAIQALIVMVIPANAPVPASRRRRRRRRRGAAGDGAHPAHAAARRSAATARRCIAAMDSADGHPGAGAAPRRPPARRARSREGASTAAARGRVVDVAGLRHRDRADLAVPAPPALRAAAARAHPPVHRPRHPQSACHRAPRRLPVRRRRRRARSRPTLLGELARAAELVAQSLDDISLEPVAREAVRAVAGRLDPALLLPDASLGDQNLIAALRPLAVDLLTATGMSSAEARACVPRI